MIKQILFATALSSAIALPAHAGDFNRNSTDLSTTEQSQTNVTTQDSLGIINQRGGANYNFQNNSAYDPVYTMYGTQRCPTANFFGKIYGNVTDNYSTTATAGGEVGFQVPLRGAGDCLKRVQETHCAALFKLEITNDLCDSLGLRKFTGLPVSDSDQDVKEPDEPTN